MDSDYPQRVTDALILEIKSEMGRRDLSSRGLGRLIGKSSQYMSDRLDGGSSKTGKRVQLTVTDLGAIADALGLSARDLVGRAHDAVVAQDLAARADSDEVKPDVSGAGEDVETRSQRDYDRAARKRSLDRGEEHF